MTTRGLPQSFLNLEKMVAYEWRFDKAFCQYLDVGLDTTEAAQKAHELASEPLDWDFGPDGNDEEDD